MKVLFLLIGALLLAGCNRAGPSPQPPAPRVGSNVVVQMGDQRHGLNQPAATWDADSGTLTVTLTRERSSGEAEAPRTRIELEINEPEKPLSLQNLGGVTLAFQGFPGAGHARMRGQNTRDAIKALQGSIKPASHVLLEIDLKGAQECRGKVVAAVH